MKIKIKLPIKENPNKLEKGKWKQKEETFYKGYIITNLFEPKYEGKDFQVVSPLGITITGGIFFISFLIWIFLHPIFAIAIFGLGMITAWTAMDKE